VCAGGECVAERRLQVILSSEAENESGTGSSDAPATNVTNGCEFNTCPAGAPPTGFNASDRMFSVRSLLVSKADVLLPARLNYVNSFP
jgi:5'-nucleotidase